MAYQPNPRIALADSMSVDAFGNLRTSQPASLITAKAVGWDDTQALVGKVTGVGASRAHSVTTSSYTLTVGTVSGAKVTHRTRARAPYQPGKSQLVEATGVLPAPKANVRARVGYFDAYDGLFFSTTDTSHQIVRRSSTSGSPVDTACLRADWDDKLDGTGPSGITFDFTKGAIPVFDLQWLGYGRVRVGASIDGQLIPICSFEHAGILSLPYMANPNLPLCWEIENVGVSASATSLLATCGQVSSEGGYDPPGYHEPVGIGQATRSVASGTVNATELLAVRLAKPRYHSLLLDAAQTYVGTTANYEWRVVLNPTGLTAGAWAVPTFGTGLVEGNFTRTGTPSGGTILDGGYVSSQQNTGADPFRSVQRFGADADDTADVLSLQVMHYEASPESFRGTLVVRTLT